MRGLLVLAALLAACGNDGDSAGADETGRTIASKGRILKTAQHALHLQGKESMDCEACHELVADEYLRAKSWLCQRCHEEHPLALHKATSSESGAQECASCHDFTSDKPDPTPCISCHKEAQGQRPAIAPHDPAKPDEACEGCHRAHQEPSLVASTCEDCHKDEHVTGHVDPKIGITGCASCHGYHEKAVTASARCTNCHRQSRGHAIPVSATFKGGHEDCVDCHNEHLFMKKEVIACTAACHEDVHVLGQGKVKEHGVCLSCHSPHDARASARASCQGCHKKQAKVKHPVDEKTGAACIGCHDIHGGSGKPVANSCTSCHNKVAGGDTMVHQGKRSKGPMCKNCHRPHSFDLKGSGKALCVSCHVQGFKNAPRVRPRKGHDDCFGCHNKKAAHQVNAPPVACTSCHKEKTKNVKGHKRCPDCHEPHSAVRRRLCNQCHAVEAATVPRGHEDCGECHEPHRPRFKKACTECHDDLSTQKLHTK